MARLLYVGEQVADDLAERIGENIDRYVDGDFLDMEASGDWQIALSVEADIDQLSELVPGGTPEDEIHNSLVVGHALRNLTPTLARENRIWIRLSHVECLEFSRARWLWNVPTDKLEGQIRKHFFAPTITGCRDDHAISRLWWNHHIAAQMLPANPARVLKVLLARADIRLSLIERSGIGMRPALGSAIIHALEKSDDLLRNQTVFREFMKAVNLLGAGIAFEIWQGHEIDSFIGRCLERAIRVSSSESVAEVAA